MDAYGVSDHSALDALLDLIDILGTVPLCRSKMSRQVPITAHLSATGSFLFEITLSVL